MTNALLDIDKHGQSTVVVVDWRAGSSPPYTQAVANIRLIGAITAHVVHMIYVSYFHSKSFIKRFNFWNLSLFRKK